MNTQIKDIGMRLASLREDFEISIEEMAEKLGENVEIYKKYENGRQKKSKTEANEKQNGSKTVANVNDNENEKEKENGSGKLAYPPQLGF